MDWFLRCIKIDVFGLALGPLGSKKERAKKSLLGPPTGKLEYTAAKPLKLRLFWHQPISGSSFRSRSTAVLPVASGRFSLFSKTRFGPGTPETPAGPKERKVPLGPFASWDGWTIGEDGENETVETGQ